MYKPPKWEQSLHRVKYEFLDAAEIKWKIYSMILKWLTNLFHLVFFYIHIYIIEYILAVVWFSNFIWQSHAFQIVENNQQILYCGYISHDVHCKDARMKMGKFRWVNGFNLFSIHFFYELFQYNYPIVFSAWYFQQCIKIDTFICDAA